MKRLLVFLAALALAALVWFFWPALFGGSRFASKKSLVAADRSSAAARRSTAPAKPLPPLEVTNLAPDLNSPATDIRADLRQVALVLETYRSNFLHDGNPVGTNAEITATLTGRNRLRLALLPPTHPAINPAGELCDRWGTPFFFHAESAAKMGIRSAGPDKKMWTADDVALEP